MRWGAGLLLWTILAAGCGRPTGILGTWKSEPSQGKLSTITLFTTFDADGSFHAEERDADRGQPLSRQRGTYVFRNGALTETFVAQAADALGKSEGSRTWTVVIDGDTMRLHDVRPDGGESMIWHRSE